MRQNRSNCVGSSPQARGTHGAISSPVHMVRFIPAGAGNTMLIIGPVFQSTVHPRRRGEHYLKFQNLEAMYGSSPQARGTHFQVINVVDIRRFIPAGAGNTPWPRSPCRRSSVHPRRRGEHALCVVVIVIPSGSSPQARGTHEQRDPTAAQHRFIPAGAGNTSSLVE